MPARISHAPMDQINALSLNVLHTPLVRKISPQRAIMQPMFRHRGWIRMLDFSLSVIFFHAARWICPLPAAKTLPATTKRKPNIKQVAFILYSFFYVMEFVWIQHISPRCGRITVLRMPYWKKTTAFQEKKRLRSNFPTSSVHGGTFQNFSDNSFQNGILGFPH